MLRPHSWWWHAIDLGHGVVTNGWKSPELLARELAGLRLLDLRGKEAEGLHSRRGVRVSTRLQDML